MARSKKTAEPTTYRRLWGIAFLPICLFLGLSLVSYDWRDISILRQPPNMPPANLIGPVGAWISFGLLFVFGLGAFLIPVCALALAFMFLFSRGPRVWPKVLWGVAVVFFGAMVAELHAVAGAPLGERLALVDMGGIVGRITMRSGLIHWLSPVGAGIVAWSLFVGSTVFFVGVHALGTAGVSVAGACTRLAEQLSLWSRERKDRRNVIEKEQRRIEKERQRLEDTIRREERQRAKAAAAERARAVQPEPEPKPEPAPQKELKERPPRRKRPPQSPTKPAKAVEPESTYILPPLSLLDEVPSSKEARGIHTDEATTSTILADTLSEFGIEAKITNVERGPVVTRYEVLPAPGIRVERIAGLANNLALSLKATSVRVQAPIPGKGVVGIEVPNETAKIVYLREVLESATWESHSATIPVVLGQDVGGTDIVVDLAKMPHMLIAGATGAGKTVCMNAILASLLMSKTPDELRLLLVDPKIVEFSVYNHLPHLVVPVVTDPKKVALGLRWAINEMEKRYKLFAKVGVRNIDSYNNRKIVTQDELFGLPAKAEEKTAIPARVPYIVIIIDELADLMLAAGAEIENCVARLAQLSRAVGIHMILSTQRPSVNVITGTIKANFPARIAFQVAQKVDSRTILDEQGADKLLGRGDMLFLPPGANKLARAQGAMVKDDEIKRIVSFIKDQAQPAYEVEIKEQIEGSATVAAELDEDDELLPQAVEIIRETRRASTSSLQRRLRIGYTRAARIMDILEDRGIIGPPRGADPREILIDLDGEIPDNAPQQETG
jgi:S-DNA-T family DNA segregation ATPase FtsK/SpoIIIE